MSSSEEGGDHLGNHRIESYLDRKEKLYHEIEDSKITTILDYSKFEDELRQDGTIIAYFKDHFLLKLDDFYFEIALKENGFAIEYIPKTRMTQHLCDIAFENQPMAFPYIPEQYKTPQMCLRAVKSYGYHLQYVPFSMWTPEMCEIAVSYDPNLKEYIEKWKMD